MNNQRLYLYCVVLITLVEIRSLGQIHLAHIKILADVAFSVTTKAPEAGLFQSRVLGPFMVLTLSRLANVPYLAAYQAFTSIVLFITNACVFETASRVCRGSARSGTIAAGATAAAFVALQDRNILYLWDYLDVLFFTIFMYGVVSRKSPLFFIPVFVVAILNRESGMYIALWIILSAFEGGKLNLRGLVCGLACALAGVAFIVFLRPHNATPISGNVFTLGANIRDLKMSLLSPASLDFLPFLCLPLIVMYVRRYIYPMAGIGPRLAGIIAVMLVADAITGWIVETRIYVSLIPIFLYAAMERNRNTTKDLPS